MTAPRLALLGALLALPACSDDSAQSATQPTPDAGLDAAPPDAPPDAPPIDAEPDAELPDGVVPELVDLGSLTSGTPIVVDIPVGTLGFHLIVRRDLGGFVGVEKITSPSQEDVVIAFTVVGAPGASTVGYEGVGAATVPQNPLGSAMPVEPGQWQVIPGSGTPGEPLTAKLYIQKTGDGAFHGGLLDLVVYVPDGLMLGEPGPAHLVSAQIAADDPGMKTRIDAFFAALGELYGIDRGSVTYVDVSADHRVITSAEMLSAAIAETTAPATGTALHVLLANGITVFGQEVWGISSGIPGGAVETGHPASGIALNVSAGFSAQADGWTLVHELGHFAGLFHTSQPDGAGGVLFDPLDDTAECSSFGGSCPDDHNIMYAAFWGGSGGIGIVASDQQRNVVRGSPLYRPFASGRMASRREPPPIPPRAPASPGELVLMSELCANSARGAAISPADLRRIALNPAVPAILRRNAVRRLESR